MVAWNAVPTKNDTQPASATMVMIGRLPETSRMIANASCQRSARLPGAAPEQVESEVTDKIEEAVNTISGIDTLTSTSSEGVSQVVVSFNLEKNADVATQEVRDKVNRILPLLPRTITQPTRGFGVVVNSPRSASANARRIMA